MWKDIEKINWSKWCKYERGYEQAERYVIANFTLEECEKMRIFVKERVEELRSSIKVFEKETNSRIGYHGGDDSFYYLLNHVVGLGEDYFNVVLKNPKLLNCIHPVECFIYCIPNKQDFEATYRKDYFETKAVMCLSELIRILNKNDIEIICFDKNTKSIIAEMIRRFSYMMQGKFEIACDDITMDNYGRFVEFTSNDKGATFANILYDCKRYKVSNNT